MEFQVKLNEMDLLDLVTFEVKNPNLIQSKILAKIIENDEAKEFILSQENSVFLLKEKPDLFLKVINCSYANSWFNEQFRLMEHETETETFLMTWVSENIAIAHKSSFRKKHMDKYKVFLGIKEIFANAFVKFSEENLDEGKNILKKKIFINGESSSVMLHWINVFDSHTEFVLKNKIIDIFSYKEAHMPAFQILDWSKEIIKGISDFVDLGDIFEDHKSILPKTILKRFSTFSQVGKISYLIPYMDEFFFGNPDKLTSMLKDFLDLSIGQLKTSKEKQLEYGMDYESFLNAVFGLKSLQENSDAKTKLKEVLLLLKEASPNLNIIANKFILDLDLPKNNCSSEVKRNKI